MSHSLDPGTRHSSAGLQSKYSEAETRRAQIQAHPEPLCKTLPQNYKMFFKRLGVELNVKILGSIPNTTGKRKNRSWWSEELLASSAQDPEICWDSLSALSHLRGPHSRALGQVGAQTPLHVKSQSATWLGHWCMDWPCPRKSICGWTQDPGNTKYWVLRPTVRHGASLQDRLRGGRSGAQTWCPTSQVQP